MLKSFDKVRLDISAQLVLETGYTLGWSPGSATYLTKLDGWTGSAPVRRSKADLLGGHGSHAERGWKDERLISVSAHHVAADRAAAADYADQIAAFLGDGTEGAFKVDDVNQGLRWAEVYLAPGAVDVTWTGGRDVSYTVHLLAPDPRKYGTPTVSLPTSPPVQGNGLVFPLFGAPASGVLDLGRGGHDGRATLTNRGTADTGPIFSVYGELVPGFTITEVTTGRRLVYTDTVSLGQTLVLDTNEGSVTLDGYAPRDARLTVAEWTRLAPGAAGTWLFQSPGAVNARMGVEVFPAWW